MSHSFKFFRQDLQDYLDFFSSSKASEIFGFHPAVVTLQRDYGAARPESQKNIQ